MPGFIVHRGATVQCLHEGQAQPTDVSPRVSVSGNPVSVQPNPYSISDCQLPDWTDGGSPPCVTANWTTVAQRVFAGGAPVVLFDSQSICQANGTPLMITQTQTRVTGS